MLSGPLDIGTFSLGVELAELKWCAEDGLDGDGGVVIRPEILS